jgi:LPXTG-motif cell wall-anchored protein
MSLARVAVIALAFGLAVGLGINSTADAQGQSTSLSLASQNGSSITGTATITELPGGKLRVEIRTNGAGAGPQPAHIHQGTCANLDPAPKFSLTSLTNGASTTELDGSLRDITSTPHAIHLHKAPDELPVYVACADIKLDAGTASQPPVLPQTGDASSLSGLTSGLTGISLIIAGLAVGRQRRH